MHFLITLAQCPAFVIFLFSLHPGFQPLLGPVLLWTTRREERRLARGKTYEPAMILERSNWVEA
jgi:uncharacterized Tic20 family protein